MVYLSTVKSFIKKCLVFTGGVFVLILVFCVVIFVLYNEDLPQGKSGAAAEEKTMAMMQALHKDKWDQIETIKWTFRGSHHYEWDKKNNIVRVKWKEVEVVLEPDKQTGTVLAPTSLSAKKEQRYVQKAYRMFNNDGFWMAGPYKILDPGTERSLVTLADGREGLKVTHTQGGTTPGDSYVWILDENHRPTSVKMWVSVIPIGGVETSWENYHLFENGVMIAKDHRIQNLINAKISNLEATFSEDQIPQPETTSKQRNEVN